jgi:hypothetical protein
MHAGEELRERMIPKTFRKESCAKKNNREAPNQNQEPLMVLRQEYLSDGGEEGFPWLR